MQEGRLIGLLPHPGPGVALGRAAVEVGLGPDGVAAIDQGLGDVAAQDAVAAVQIGDGAGQAQGARPAAGAATG